MKAEPRQKSDVKKFYLKFTRKYLVVNKTLLLLFLADMLIFATICVTFFTKLGLPHIKKDTNVILDYFVIVCSFYFLLKFTFTNFMFESIYFKKIKIYDEELKLGNLKIKASRIVNYVPVQFMVLLILINIIVVIILNLEVDEIKADAPILQILVTTLSTLLLIQSFSSALNKIVTIKKGVNDNYKLLIRDQFYANRDFIKNHTVVNDYEYIEFPDLSVVSKKGVFLMTSVKDPKVKQTLLDHNLKVIEIYKDI